ncbi:hypothetical protein ACFFOP_14615 [Sinosporangium siamense]|uniref:hypothetical protein n=1 Tax=Sinosporangium siamense TaxID=1367973 RepID=UPI0035E9FB9A
MTLLENLVAGRSKEEKQRVPSDVFFPMGMIAAGTPPGLRWHGSRPRRAISG